MVVSMDAVEERISDILDGLDRGDGTVSPEVLLAALVGRIAMLEVQHEDLKEKLAHIGIYQ